jgi:3-oxoacyl-(acyl-carrier-protein) synthase
MVLGEGAGMACLKLGYVPDALAYIEGIGYATEVLKHSVSISAEADCMQKSMRMALEGIDPNDIDAVVMHAPGTVKGDTSEYAAVQQVFGTNLPLLTTNKWKIGHTFGASGLLSLEFAVMMLQHNHFIPSPFMPQRAGRPLKKILVNAVGFGGNAVSVVVSR